MQESVCVFTMGLLVNVVEEEGAKIELLVSCENVSECEMMIFN